MLKYIINFIIQGREIPVGLKTCRSSIWNVLHVPHLVHKMFEVAPRFLQNLRNHSLTLYDHKMGCIIFPDLYEAPQNSRRQNGDMAQVQFRGPTHIRHYRTKLRRKVELTPEICVPLHSHISVDQLQSDQGLGVWEANPVNCSPVQMPKRWSWDYHKDDDHTNGL